MYFTLTAIDREGKEWEVDMLSSPSNDMMVIYLFLDDYDAPKHDKAILRWNAPNNRYIIKELSTPSELRAWREKWD